MKTTDYQKYLILQELYSVHSDRISEQFKQKKQQTRTQSCLFSQVNEVKCIIEEDTYAFVQLRKMLLIILSTSPQLISSGQYGCDHQSRLEKSKDNQLYFYLNDSHHEYSIELSIKSNLVPIILQKLKEDYSGIDLIHLGYIPYPIEDCDPDALLQKVLQEIQEQQQVLKILNKDKKIFFTLYKDDL